MTAREQVARMLCTADMSKSDWYVISEKGRAPYFRMADAVLALVTKAQEDMRWRAIDACRTGVDGYGAAAKCAKTIRALEPREIEP